MNYALGHALNTEELFLNFNTSKLQLTSNECEELIGDKHRMKLAQRIFRKCVQLVVDDIIEDGNTFNLPGNRHAKLYIKRVSDDDFAKARRLGKWSDVDFLASNFSGHQMTLEYQSTKMTLSKPVYLNPARRDKITKYTNEGKAYY